MDFTKYFLLVLIAILMQITSTHQQITNGTVVQSPPANSTPPTTTAAPATQASAGNSPIKFPE